MKNQILKKSSLAISLGGYISLLFLVMSCESEKPLDDQVNNNAYEAFPGLDGEIKEFLINGDTIVCEKFDTTYVFEGDIILTKYQLYNSDTTKGAGVQGLLTWLWPNGNVFYDVSSIGTTLSSNIEEAMTRISASTNIQFIERDPLDKSIQNFIEFKSVIGDVSSSFLGMAPIGVKQSIELSSDAPVGTIIHELGHAIGLGHEHSRWDRDKWLEIHLENVTPKKYRDQFRRHHFKYYTEELDFNSIMLYGSSAFSKPKTSTITLRDGGGTYEAQRVNLSPGDIEIINQMYPPDYPKITVPIVTTLPATNIQRTYAMLGVKVTSDGGAMVSEKGCYISRSPDFEATDKVRFGEGSGTTNQYYGGLIPGVRYYIKGYAINSEGSGYGNLMSFTTLYDPNQNFYSNDFSGDLGDWTTYNGTWQIRNGELYANYTIGCGSITCAQADLLLKDQFQPEGDWSISVDFTRATDPYYPTYSASGAALTVWESASKKIRLSVGNGGSNWGTTQLDKINVGYAAWNGNWYKNINEDINFDWLPTNWYKMTIEKNGNIYKIYVNDTFLLQFTDTYLNGVGKVGLQTYGPKLYDNFVIKKLGK